MITNLRAELAKILTLPRSWWLVLILIGWVAVIGLITMMGQQSTPEHSFAQLIPLTPLVSITISAMLAGSEFGPQLSTTLLAVPQRSSLVAARWTVSVTVLMALSALAGAVFGLVCAGLGQWSETWEYALALGLQLFIASLLAWWATEMTRSTGYGLSIMAALLWVVPLVFRVTSPSLVDWLPLENVAAQLFSDGSDHGWIPLLTWLGASMVLAALSWRKDASA